MRSLFLLHIIAICLCWMSCGHSSTERLLAEAEARLEHQPDSALAMLQRLPVSEWRVTLDMMARLFWTTM